jgi:glycosyltransferase 2 family protein
VFRGYVISFLPRYVPGTVWGYLSRSEWLMAEHGVPFNRSAWGSILEAGLIVVSGLAICASYVIWQAWYAPWRFIIIPLFLLQPWLTWYMFKLIRQLLARHSPAWQARIDLPIVKDGWVRAYFIYLTMWACHGLALMLIMGAFGAGDISAAFQITFIYSIAWLVGFFILIVPAGLGVREFMLSSLLVSQCLLRPETASAIAVTSRLSVYVAEIIWLLVGVLLTRAPGVRNRQPDAREDQADCGR